MKDIQELLSEYKIRVKNRELFELAFTHKSFNGDANTKHHDYERLEFLGDSVLGCVVAELAFKTHQDMAQGPLTKLKSAIVSTVPLAETARQMHLDEYVRVGNSFANDVSKSDSLLEDVFEAFVGALYLDQGFTVTRKLLIKVLHSHIQAFQMKDLTDYKSRLQEEMQAEHRESVVYEVIKEEGPSHQRTFTVQVTFDGVILGVGKGSTKKKAEQEAAKAALDKRVG